MLSDARRDSLGLVPSRLLRLERGNDPRLSVEAPSVDSRRLLGLRTK